MARGGTDNAGVGPSDTGGAGTGPIDVTAGGTELALPEPPAAPPFPANPFASPDLDPDTVRTACAGSAVAGLSLIVAGVLTGSSRGLGSSLSGLGSAAVGSAMTGSGLACLLWPQDLPPFPGLPLLLAPPTTEAPTRPVQFPEILAAPPPALPSQRQQPLPPPPPPLAAREPITPTTDPIAWNMLQLVTVMLVAVLGTVRTGATYIRRHKHN